MLCEFPWQIIAGIYWFMDRNVTFLKKLSGHVEINILWLFLMKNSIPRNQEFD